jgi:tetratricopeptide (TPR) repeat protein
MSTGAEQIDPISSISPERHPQTTYHVFISSTSVDLKAYREEVLNTLLSLKAFPIDMKHFGAQDGDATSVSLKELDAADLYLGIFAWRYGYVPDGQEPGQEYSVTHQEYLRARELQLPCLLFLADEKTRPTEGTEVYFPAGVRDPERLEHLLAFRQEIMNKRVVAFFTSSKDLALQVSTAVSRWLREQAEAEARQRPGAPDILPERLQSFVGRAQEAQRLVELLRAGKHVALTGMGGLGKSSLAGEVAHTLRDETGLFPGGFLWVKCQDRREAPGLVDIYTQIMNAWRLALTEDELKRATTPKEEASMREQALLVRLRAQGSGSKRPQALVVLDNVEHDFPLKQALETLGALDMTILLTSRKETIPANVSLVRLKELDSQAARDLFAETYRNREGSWDETRDAPHASIVVAALGHLPLAIELAAARAAALGMSVKEVAAEFQQPGIIDRLSQPDEDEGDAHASIRLAFEQSLALLKPGQRSRFAALGLLTGSDWPRPVIEQVFAAVAQSEPGARLPLEDVRSLSTLSLITLASPEAPEPVRRPSLTFLTSLLRSDSPDASLIDLPASAPADPRVRIHPLLRELAREQFAQQPVAVQRAVLDALLSAVEQLIQQHNSDFSRLAQEEELIVGTLRAAARERVVPERLSAIIDTLFEYFLTGGHWLRGMELLTLQRNARQDLGDHAGEGATLNNLGQLATNLGRIEQADYILNQALSFRRAVGDRAGEGVTLHNLGLLAYLQGKMKEAKECFDKALSIARDVHDQRGEGTALSSQGLLIMTKGNNDKAIELYEQALPLLRAAGDQRVEGIVLSSLGILAQGKGRLEEAAGYYRQALRIHRKIGNRPEEGATLYHLGFLAQDLGHTEEALRYYEQALAIAHEFGNQRMEAGALLDLGRLALVQGHEAEAEKYYQQALKMQQNIGDRTDEGMTLTYLGALYQRQGRVDKARQVFEQALLIHHEIGNRSMETETVYGLGQLAQSQGQQEEAFRYYEEALTYSNRYGDTKEEGNILSTLGVLLRDMEQYEQAGNYFQRALVIHRDLGNRREEGVALNNLGLVALNLKQYEQAERSFQDALLIHREVGARKEEATILSNLEFLARTQSHHQEALDFGAQVLAIHRDLGNRREEGIALNHLGLAALNLKQYEQAERSFQDALLIHQELGNRSDEITPLRNLEYLARIQNRYEEAIRYGTELLALCRALGNHQLEGVVLNNLGLAAARLKQNQQARAWYEQALAIHRENENLKETATTIGNLVILAKNEGNPGDALGYARQKLEVCRTLGDQELLAALNSASQLASAQEQLEEAAGYYQEIVALDRALGKRQEEGLALMALGSLMTKLGRLEEALRFFQLALPVLRELGNRGGQLQALVHLSNASQALGRLEEATESFEQAVALQPELKNPQEQQQAIPLLKTLATHLITAYQHSLDDQLAEQDQQGAVQTLITLGWVATLSKQDQEVRGYFERALALAKEAGLQEGEGRALACLGVMAQKQNALRDAAGYFQQAIAVFQQINAADLAQQVEAMLTALDFTPPKNP